MTDSSITIEYGTTDQDCIDVHLFLCVVGGPSPLAPIDANDSISEIMRVRDEGVFLIARKEGHIIGSLGLILVPWWYNTKEKFFVNRWFSVFPQFHHAGVGVRLEAEAAAVGQASGYPVVIMSHAKRRKHAAPSEPFFVRDHVAAAAQPTEDSHGVRPKHN